MEIKMRTCGDEYLSKGREPIQLGWYDWSKQFCKNKRVLDVGCGMGIGLKILSEVAEVDGIDLDPRLVNDNISCIDINNIEDNSYDIIICSDVIEHVKRDSDFLSQLIRVARDKVILTTPNWQYSRCKNPYHCREYTPEGFVALLSDLSYDIFYGDSEGYYIFKPPIYFKPHNFIMGFIMQIKLIRRIPKILQEWFNIPLYLPHQAAIITLKR